MAEEIPDGVFTGSYGYAPVVHSWLGTRLLAADIPVESGEITEDRAQEVPERLTMRVPARHGADDVFWVPGTDTLHPLADYGQTLDVSIRITSHVRRRSWDVRQGKFRINSWSYDDTEKEIEVEAVGILQRAADDRLLEPSAPMKGGSLESEIRRLMPAGIPVLVSPDLVDRRCPSSMVWDEDRLGALYEIVDAWPARMYVDETGAVCVEPPLPLVPDPVITLRDGENGTVVSTPQSSTRDESYNCVVATSSATFEDDRVPPTGYAQITSGPMSVYGEYGRVTMFFDSPILENVAQCRAASQTRLQDVSRRNLEIPAEIAPDPRRKIDEAVQLISDDQRWFGYVNARRVPLTIDDGAMTLTVGVV